MMTSRTDQAADRGPSTPPERSLSPSSACQRSRSCCDEDRWIELKRNSFAISRHCQQTEDMVNLRVMLFECRKLSKVLSLC